ncbi:pyridoxamine 5'-phosphate oxidase family protein [Streptomyces sp. NPDC047022]|uniref:pyridoxamine 5'-phosphate oxidase family protein n=1 Tax=Streptomyces sp. NPDC047022 TaxID=3155737 RepID=UPI0033E1646C
MTSKHTSLPPELRELIESGPMAHLSTINPDGSPQVTVIWIGLDGDQIVSGHMSRHVKVRNVTPPPAGAGGFSLCRVGVATDQPGP